MLSLPTNIRKKRSNSYWIFFLIVLAILPWLIRLGMFGDVTFGYDTGIYKRNIPIYATAGLFHQLPPFSFMSITTIVSSLGLPLDAVLFGGYIATLTFTLYMAFLFFRERLTNVTSLIATALFAFSTSTIVFVHFFYYRNLLAIGLSLLIMWLYRHSLWYLLPLALLMYIHPITGGIVTLALTVIYFRKKAYRDIFALLTIVALVVLANSRELGGYVADILLKPENYSTEYHGQFLSLKSILLNTLPYLPFAIYALFAGKRIPKVLSYVVLISLLWATLTLPFYRRLFIFVDIALIYLAAQGIIQLWHTRKRLSQGSIIAFLLLIVFAGWSGIVNRGPIFTAQDIIAIETAAKKYSDSNTAILSHSSYEAPWLRGYAPNIPLIAPGLFDENKWDRDDWQLFWQTTDPETLATLFDDYTFDPICIFATSNKQSLLEAQFANNPAVRYDGNGFWCHTK